MKAVGSPTAMTSELSGGASRVEWRERSARLYSDFEPASRAMVRRAFGAAFGEDELDDIYSNAWLGTLRALETRHADLTDDEIRSYVFAAVAHQAGREIRRRKRKPTAPLDAAAGRADAGPGPDDQVLSGESSQVSRDLLASLPPRRRSVMLLRYGWGLEPKQVCRLVKGLSPRAYRKEITRGVDELAEKVRSFERGEWCLEREPVLKAFAAGVADAEQLRQAQAHLAHCRDCNHFVARLHGHLHDLGGAALAPAAVDGLSRDLSWSDRLGDLAERAREGVAGLLGRSPSTGSEDAIAGIASSGGARGAGAAGAGVLAKLASVGAAGKVAVACVGGGVAASACIAAGIGPVNGGEDGGATTAVEASAAASAAAGPESPPLSETLPSQVGYEPQVATPESAAAAAAESDSNEDPESEQPVESTKPVSAETPPQTQEFGLEAAVAPTSEAPVQVDADAGGSTGESTATSGGSAVREEFGP